MPFKSKAQQKQCYALKAKGKAGTWDCDEWADETKDFKNLPEKVKKKEKGRMENNSKYIKFLDDITTPETEIFVESVKKAYNVCFEYYAGDEDYAGEEGEDGSGDIPTGNTASAGGTGASAMNEEVSGDDKLDNIEKQKAVLAKKEELTKEQIELEKAQDTTDIEAGLMKEEEGGEEVKDVQGMN